MCPLCSMNRRLFLRKFGIGTAALAGAATLGGMSSLLAPGTANAVPDPYRKESTSSRQIWSHRLGATAIQM